MAIRGKQFKQRAATETNREGTRKSEVIVRTVSKDSEGGLTRLPANRDIGHISNSNRTLINEDKHSVLDKSSLIDSEALEGDEAQATLECAA